MQHRVLLTDLTFKQTDRDGQSRRTKLYSGRIGCLQLKRKLPSCLMRKPIKNRPILSAVFSAQTLSGGSRFREALTDSLCANMSETSSPSTITVGRGKKSHFDKHGQDKYFFRCVGSFGA